LLKAVPYIINVLLIAALFFFIFAIIGVNFLKGLFYYCDSTGPSTLTGFDLLKYNDKWDCLNSGGEWERLSSDYDEILSSLIEIFMLS
jgi:voltage-dependent calcium channel T type alpha-1G